MDSNWIDEVHKCLNSLISEEELPQDSLHIMGNVGKKKEEVNSYSVCIYEPEFPSAKKDNEDPGRNLVVLRIIPMDDKYEIVINKSRYELENPIDGITIKNVKSDPDFAHLIFDDDIEKLVGYIKRATKYSIDHYTSKARAFGCCSLFEQCSDAKKCLHENRLYSKACYYRHHLDAGEIFYGKNKNV